MIRRGNVGSIVVMVLAAMAVAYSWWWDRGAVTDAERNVRKNHVFSVFRAEDVTRIDIEHAGEKLTLVRAVYGWQMTSPHREIANVAAVDDLLQRLGNAVRVRSVEAGTGFAGAPARAIGAIAIAKREYHFALGAIAPTPQGGSYMRVDGDGSFVVTADIADALLKRADAYRERNIVPYASSALAKLEIRRGSGEGAGAANIGAGGSFVIARGSGGGADDWFLAGLGYRASRSGLERVWSALGELRAESFVDDAQAERAIASRAITVLMSPRATAEPPGELVIGGECPGEPEDVVVVRVAPAPRVSVCAPRGALDGLAKTPESLIDTRLFAANEDEIAELSLQALPRDQRLDLARSGVGWHERAPQDRPLAVDQVDPANALAAAISRTSGEIVGRKALPGSLRGRAIITRARAEFLPQPPSDSDDSARDDVVELSAPDASGTIYARRAADGAVLKVSPSVARLLAPRPLALRPFTLFNPPLEGAPIEALSTRCGPVAQDVVHTEAEYTMRAPAGFRPDVARWLDLANAFEHAKAEMWIADEDDGTFGFAQNQCTASITATRPGEAPRTARLTFGDEAEGGYYARIDGDPAVFVVSKAIRELAGELLIDRSGFTIDPTHVAALTLMRPTTPAALTSTSPTSTTSVAFRASGGHLRAVDGGAELETLEASLASLRADRAIHIGPARAGEGFEKPSLVVRATFAADAGERDRHFEIGAALPPSDGATSPVMYYARIDGTDATYAISKPKVDALISALGW